MTISITDLTVTDNMASAKKPFLTDWRESLDSIETFMNASIKNNMNQLALEIDANYTIGQTGEGILLNNLYNKYSATVVYTTGNVALPSNVTFTDHPIVVTGESIQSSSKFRLVCMVNVQIVGSVGTPGVFSGYFVFDNSGGSVVSTRNVYVRETFNTANVSKTIPVRVDTTVTIDVGGGTKNVYLRFIVGTISNVTASVLINRDDPLVYFVEKI